MVEVGEQRRLIGVQFHDQRSQVGKVYLFKKDLSYFIVLTHFIDVVHLKTMFEAQRSYRLSLP